MSPHTYKGWKDKAWCMLTNPFRNRSRTSILLILWRPFECAFGHFGSKMLYLLQWLVSASYGDISVLSFPNQTGTDSSNDEIPAWSWMKGVDVEIQTKNLCSECTRRPLPPPTVLLDPRDMCKCSSRTMILGAPCSLHLEDIVKVIWMRIWTILVVASRWLGHSVLFPNGPGTNSMIRKEWKALMYCAGPESGTLIRSARDRPRIVGGVKVFLKNWGKPALKGCGIGSVDYARIRKRKIGVT